MDPVNDMVIASAILKKIIVKVKDCAYEKTVFSSPYAKNKNRNFNNKNKK